MHMRLQRLLGIETTLNIFILAKLKILPGNEIVIATLAEQTNVQARHLKYINNL